MVTEAKKIADKPKHISRPVFCILYLGPKYQNTEQVAEYSLAQALIIITDYKITLRTIIQKIYYTYFSLIQNANTVQPYERSSISKNMFIDT